MVDDVKIIIIQQYTVIIMDLGANHCTMSLVDTLQLSVFSQCAKEKGVETPIINEDMEMVIAKLNCQTL